MKTLCYSILFATICAVNSYGQDPDTTKPKAKLKTTSAKLKVVRPESSVSDVLTRVKPSDVEAAGAKKAKVVVNELKQQSKLAEKRLVKGQLEAKGKLAQDARVKASPNVAKKISPTSAKKLKTQGKLAQDARVKASPNVAKKLSPTDAKKLKTQGKLAQDARTPLKSQPQVAKSTQPPKSILKKNVNQTSGTALNQPKKVQFQQQVQVKQIPHKPNSGLKNAGKTKLKAPVASKSSGMGSKVGKAAAAAGAAALVAESASNWGNADQQLKAGKITQAQYNKLQATNAVNMAGEAAKLKKLNPASIVLNDVIGTDPLSLGIEGVGDLINGTNNAEQSLKDMEKSWNKSLTKQAFTDPEGAVKRVGKDLEQTGREIEKVGQNVGKEIDTIGKNVGKEVDKVGKAVDKSAKDVDKFFKGVFKPKK